MTDKLLQDGPADYFSAAKEPTLAQWRALAAAALVLLDVNAPTSRLEASETLVRLRLAETDAQPQAVRRAA